MTWTDALWDELSSPAWAAGVLETLVGAGFALAGALFLLRRQLSHDRRLTRQQQLAAEGRVYGRQLLEAYDALNSLSYVEAGKALRRAKGKAPGARQIYEAANSAQAPLGYHKAVFDLWRERSHLWRSWQSCLIRLECDGWNEETLNAVLGESVLSLLHTNNERLGDTATALIRWDGAGALPGPKVLGKGFVSVPLPPSQNREAYDEWRRQASIDFESAVESATAKRRT